MLLDMPELGIYVKSWLYINSVSKMYRRIIALVMCIVERSLVYTLYYFEMKIISRWYIYVQYTICV
jgi:hypothetical protein